MIEILRIHFVTNYYCCTCGEKTYVLFYSFQTGWLDCPPSGQEICCMIPSKVPLGESFNDCIFPGKRYSFKQVIHQQRVLGRKVSRTYPKNVILHLGVFLSVSYALSLIFSWILNFEQSNQNERGFYQKRKYKKDLYI
jgi:hypothetical protein